MRQLNGVYAQYSNRRHRRVGHLFQGRYKAILVDGDSYLLELARYVVLNPVRAGMVKEPGEWTWSSYLAMQGKQPTPSWLQTDGLLASFGQRRSLVGRLGSGLDFILKGIKQPTPSWLQTDGLLAAFGQRLSLARRRYMEFVLQGIGCDPIWNNLKFQVFLGDDEFVVRSLSHAESTDDVSVPRTQRRPPPPSLEEIAGRYPERNAAIAAAYANGSYSYQRIGEFFGLHFTTVAKIIRQSKLK